VFSLLPRRWTAVPMRRWDATVPPASALTERLIAGFLLGHRATPALPTTSSPPNTQNCHSPAENTTHLELHSLQWPTATAGLEHLRA
jgi:hypothetical protein